MESRTNAENGPSPNIHTLITFTQSQFHQSITEYKRVWYHSKACRISYHTQLDLRTFKLILNLLLATTRIQARYHSSLPYRLKRTKLWKYSKASPVQKKRLWLSISTTVIILTYINPRYVTLSPWWWVSIRICGEQVSNRVNSEVASVFRGSEEFQVIVNG